jgi:hypothetical protein
MSPGWDADDIVQSLRGVMRLTGIPSPKDTCRLVDLVRHYHRIDVRICAVLHPTAWRRPDGWWEIVIPDHVNAWDRDDLILYHIGNCLRRGNNSLTESLQDVNSIDSPKRLLPQLWKMEHEAGREFVLAWRLPAELIGWANEDVLLKVSGCGRSELEARQERVLARERIFNSRRTFIWYSRLMNRARALGYQLADMPSSAYGLGILVFIGFILSVGIMTGAPLPGAKTALWSSTFRGCCLFGTAVMAALLSQVALLRCISPTWSPRWPVRRVMIMHWYRVSAGFTTAAFAFSMTAWLGEIRVRAEARPAAPAATTVNASGSKRPLMVKPAGHEK